MSRRATIVSPGAVTSLVKAAEKGTGRPASSVKADTVRGTVTITFNNGTDPSQVTDDGDENPWDTVLKPKPDGANGNK